MGGVRPADLADLLRTARGGGVLGMVEGHQVAGQASQLGHPGAAGGGVHLRPLHLGPRPPRDGGALLRGSRPRAPRPAGWDRPRMGGGGRGRSGGGPGNLGGPRRDRLLLLRPGVEVRVRVVPLPDGGGPGVVRHGPPAPGPGRRGQEGLLRREHGPVRLGPGGGPLRAPRRDPRAAGVHPGSPLPGPPQAGRHGKDQVQPPALVGHVRVQPLQGCPEDQHQRDLPRPGRG